MTIVTTRQDTSSSGESHVLNLKFKSLYIYNIHHFGNKSSNIEISSACQVIGLVPLALSQSIGAH